MRDEYYKVTHTQTRYYTLVCVPFTHPSHHCQRHQRLLPGSVVHLSCEYFTAVVPMQNPFMGPGINGQLATSANRHFHSHFPGNGIGKILAENLCCYVKRDAVICMLS